MTLIEIMLCVLILSMLCGGAYMSYVDHTRLAKETATKNSQEKIREALQIYNTDYPRHYHWHTPHRLVGSYLDAEPNDGWGQDFIIDYVFNRVISRGQNGILDTVVPFHDECPTNPDPIINDDLVMLFDSMGDIAFVSNQTMSMIEADGSRQRLLIPSNVEPFFDLSPGSASIIYANSGDNSLHIV